MPPQQTFRGRLGAVVGSARVQRAVIGRILLNAVTLGLETSPTVMSTAGGWLLALDAAIVAVFTVEVALRLFARGPRCFLDGWNLFDFRSEEHTSELQYLMRISYAVFCLK